MPAVLGLVIEVITVSTGGFVPFIAVVHKVSTSLTVFAIKFLGLFVGILLAIIVSCHVFELQYDALEEQLPFALVIPCLGAVSSVSCITVPKSSAFSFSLNNANELLQAYILKWVSCSVTPSLSNISLSKSVPRQRQR